MCSYRYSPCTWRKYTINHIGKYSKTTTARSGPWTTATAYPEIQQASGKGVIFSYLSDIHGTHVETIVQPKHEKFDKVQVQVYVSTLTSYCFFTSDLHKDPIYSENGDGHHRNSCPILPFTPLSCKETVLSALCGKSLIGGNIVPARAWGLRSNARHFAVLRSAQNHRKLNRTPVGLRKSPWISVVALDTL